jgi:hypothetical protein
MTRFRPHSRVEAQLPLARGRLYMIEAVMR